MDPFERWDDWEFEKAAREIGQNGHDRDYVRNKNMNRYAYERKPYGTFIEKINGSQKRVLLSAFLFLAIVFSSQGSDSVSKGVYSVYKSGMESGNLYTALNSMAKEAIGIQDTESLPVNATKQEIFYPPVAGAVKVAFAGTGLDGKSSRGIEVESSIGTAVLCPQEGVVLEVTESSTYGQAVHINFGNGWEGFLGNFGEIKVVQGQPVSKGMTLGTVGISSAREKPWFYLELLKDGEPVNPLNYLIQN
ncbi:peptidoglycan DD-metalloendopeptidase family protein [Dehalobacter sp. DCM]|uniref:murein hydrolase activator EnvC family protein n=1 Tax=Dehalobacter sp. DCM TaxID=2907827 RepID=UPI003081B10A|nr:peptidoglycan DD-metalloendopeptidase family protein [Dehalobacter sp. DCM]